MNPGRFNLWTPGAIRIFMSHVSAHKARVGQIGDFLASFGFSCFVAHDAIQPSRAWQEAIQRALQTCDVLVAYLSPEFSRSDWADQEVGWALGRGIPIVPIDAGAKPYGFLGAFQAMKTSAEMPVNSLALEVTRAIAIAAFHQTVTNQRTADAMADLIIEAFCTSPGYESTRQRFTLLQLIPAACWSATRREQIEGALVGNRQIAEAKLARSDAGPRRSEGTHCGTDLVAAVIPNLCAVEPNLTRDELREEGVAEIGKSLRFRGEGLLLVEHRSDDRVETLDELAGWDNHLDAK